MKATPVSASVTMIDRSIELFRFFGISDITLLLCATSVFSVSPWFSVSQQNHHRDTENTEVAQRKLTLISGFHESSLLRIPGPHFSRDTEQIHARRRATAPVAFARVPTAVGFEPVAVPRDSAIEFYDLFSNFTPDCAVLKRDVGNSTTFYIAPIGTVVTADRFNRFFLNLG